MKAEITILPRYTVAYIRSNGPYCRATNDQSLHKLLTWKEFENYIKTGKLLTIYLDNPEFTMPADCRSDLCITVPEGTTSDNAEVRIQEIPAGKYASFSYSVSSNAECARAWKESFDWVFNSEF